MDWLLIQIDHQFITDHYTLHLTHCFVRFWNQSSLPQKLPSTSGTACSIQESWWIQRVLPRIHGWNLDLWSTGPRVEKCWFLFSLGMTTPDLLHVIVFLPGDIVLIKKSSESRLSGGFYNGFHAKNICRVVFQAWVSSGRVQCFGILGLKTHNDCILCWLASEPAEQLQKGKRMKKPSDLLKLPKVRHTESSPCCQRVLQYYDSTKTYKNWWPHQVKKISWVPWSPCLRMDHLITMASNHSSEAAPAVSGCKLPLLSA